MWAPETEATSTNSTWVCTTSPAYMLWLTWCSFGTPNSGSRVFLTLLSALGIFSYYCIALSSLDMGVCAYSYCILLCYVQMMSMGDLLFSERKWRRNESGEEGRWEEWREKKLWLGYIVWEKNLKKCKYIMQKIDYSYIIYILYEKMQFGIIYVKQTSEEKNYEK